MRWLLIATMGMMAMGCARRATASSPTAARSRTETVAFLRAQLAGHLDRAQGCFDDAARRHPGEGGMVRYAFDIRPDGQVEGVDVEAFAQDDHELARCVRSRLVSLFFDPAPHRAVHIDRTFVFCEDDEDGVCRLGSARATTEGVAPGLLARVNEGLAARDSALRACADRGDGGEAVFDVRLALGADGRIMEGRVMRSFPEASALRRCAVGPLLGAQIEGEAPGQPVELRYVYRLGTPSAAQARR